MYQSLNQPESDITTLERDLTQPIHSLDHLTAQTQ